MKWLLPLLLVWSVIAGYQQVVTLAAMEDGAKSSVDELIPELNIDPGTFCSRKPNLPWQINCTWAALPAVDILQTCYANKIRYIFASPLELSTRPEFLEHLRTGRFYPYYRILRFSPRFLLLELNPPPYYTP